MDNNTSESEQFSSIDMVNEISHEDIDINEVLFGSNSQLNTNDIFSPNRNDSETSTHKIDQSMLLPSNDYAAPNLCNQIESIGNSPTYISLDMPSSNNHQEKTGTLLLPDFPGTPSFVISPDSLQEKVEGPVYDLTAPSGNSQSTYASSNGLIYQMLNTVKNQFLQQPLENVAYDSTINEPTSKKNQIISGISLRNSDESQSPVSPSTGSINFENSSSHMIQNEPASSRSQEANFDRKVLRVTSRRNDEKFDGSLYHTNYEINGDPLVFVPLSILRSCLNRKILHLPSQETNNKKNVQGNTNTQDGMQLNLSCAAMKAPGKDEKQFHLMMRGNDLTTPSMDDEIQITRKSRDGTMKNDQQLKRYDKIELSETGNDNHRDLKSSINAGTDREEIYPQYGEQEERKYSERNPNVKYVCKVCGDTATNHIHYGGKSCPGCRAFFRRTVESIARQEGFSYPCKCNEGCLQKGETTCLINKSTRNYCKYCRFKKCQMVAGMSRTWVKSVHIPKVERRPITKPRKKGRESGRTCNKKNIMKIKNCEF